MTPKRTPDQRLATVDRQIAQLRLAIGSVVVQLAQGRPVTAFDADRILKLLEDPK